jgi:isochorismate hydrolase
MPTVYVNDNMGRWRSDFPGMVRHCMRKGSRGEPVTRLLVPDKTDYCILKPKHSGFFATALDTLLTYIGARKLVLTGTSSHQCVLFTANDAYVRDLELHIPRDCICAASKPDTRVALQYFSTVLHADVRPSRELRFTQGRS